MKGKAFDFVLAAMFTVLVAGGVFGQTNADLATTAINHGNTAFNQKDYDTVIREYTEVIRLSPNFSGAYYNRGIAYYNKEDDDRAVVQLFTQTLNFSGEQNTSFNFLNWDMNDTAKAARTHHQWYPSFSRNYQYYALTTAIMSLITSVTFATVSIIWLLGSW
jgi:tetratricopeptide (TPR) repeat protein